MFAKKPETKSIIIAALILTAAGVLIAPKGLARIMKNTIDPVATIAEHGNHIIVTGPIQCDLDQPIDLRVTITQRTTGAVAEGNVHSACATTVQQWTVKAALIGSSDFEEGEATAVALATSKVLGQADDAHQWLVDVMLVEE